MTIAPPHTVVLASAGTGKTHALTSRYLSLIAAGESPERILATTFTRKAAGEILRKVIARLAEGAKSEENARSLGAQIRIPTLDAGECARLLVGMVRAIDRLSIGTIDSFFAKLAGGYAFALGGRDWRLIDDDEDEALRSEAVSRVMRDGDRAELMDLVRRRNPGMAERSVHAGIVGAVDDAYRHYLASEKDAWGKLVIPQGLGGDELAAAIEQLRCLDLPLTKAGTPNSRWRTATDAALRAVAEERWGDFLETGIVTKLLCKEEFYDRHEIRPDVRRVLESLIGHAASTLLGELPQRTLATWGMLDRFHRAYRGLKEAGGLCTFDDVPRLLFEHAAADSMQEMYYRLDARLHHVLLDEFQDTSLIQWRLLEPLVAEIVSQEGDRSLLAVGDVKQSLYGWRQAAPELLAGIPLRWPQVQREELVASWRSSPVVIDTVNEVMGGITDNPAVGGARGGEGMKDALSRWRVMFQQHTTKKDFPGYCRLTVSPEETETCSVKDGALRAAAERIKELHSRSPQRSIGVLFRSGKLIAPMKAELARGADGIQASEEGGNPLTDCGAVAAALSMLTLADHPANSAALFHVASSPLGPVTGVRYGMPHREVCETAAKLRLRLLAEGFAGVLEDWLRRVAPSCSARDARRMDQLVSLGVRFDARSSHDPTTRASRFVEFASRQRVEDPTAAPVRLMTMHASKGLEFDIVVLPWLDDAIASRPPSVLEDRDPDDATAQASMVTLCPPKALICLHPRLEHLYERWKGRELLEELCVLYVAMTRAAHSIEMFVPPSKKTIAEFDGSTLSFARILRGALNPGVAIAGEVAWSAGDPGWADAPPTREAAVPPTAGHTVRGIPAIRLDLREASRTRHVPRGSPTLDTPGPHGPSFASWGSLDDTLRSATSLARGVLFHAWLEMIGWLEDGVPTDSALLDAAARVPLPPGVDLGSLVNEFRTLLGGPTLRALLTRSGYAGAPVELRRELPFAISLCTAAAEPRLLVGRLDRLVIVSDDRGRTARAEVIDFKTDRITDLSPAGLKAHAASYADQMRDYRIAAGRLLACPESSVRTRLVFVTHGEVVEG